MVQKRRPTIFVANNVFCPRSLHCIKTFEVKLILCLLNYSVVREKAINAWPVGPGCEIG